MALEAVQIVTSSVSYAFEVFVNLLSATGLQSFYFAMVAIALIVAYLLSPFLQQVSSDGVRSARKQKNDRKDK